MPSLFLSCLQANTKWVEFISDSPKPPPKRVTLTFPVINNAAVVALIVTGSTKADTLKVYTINQLSHYFSKESLSFYHDSISKVYCGQHLLIISNSLNLMMLFPHLFIFFSFRLF